MTRFVSRGYRTKDRDVCNTVCGIGWKRDVNSFETFYLYSGEAEVQVRVTDMNDNTPFFKDRLYTARVPENTDPGTVIITVIAEDKDEGHSTFSLIFRSSFVIKQANS